MWKAVSISIHHQIVLLSATAENHAFLLETRRVEEVLNQPMRMQGFLGREDWDQIDPAKGV